MLKLSDASVEDVETRLAELKGDFIEMSEGRRSEIDDDGLRDMIREVDTLDTWLTMSAAVERREQAKVAATAGALTEKGIRSIGEAFLTEEALASIARDGGASSEFTLNGVAGSRKLAFESELDGDEGRQMSQWLRYAGVYGADGLRASINEWGSGGPPNFGTDDAGGLLPVGQPIPPVPRQAKLYLRDLIPHMTTTLATVPYVRELNPASLEAIISGGANTVAEGATKPNANLSFVSVQAPISTIATTLTLSKQMFADAPAVISYINQRLPYLVKFREDAQFLNGSGTWPNIEGIANTPGIQSQGATSGEFAITIGNAFAKVENTDGSPTAVVFNPNDAWAMFTKRAAGGAGTFDAGTPFSSLPLTVWGVQTYRSRAYAQGTALVADFERGAVVADRQSVNLQSYNERYAEQNLVLLICEERLGLLVPRPDLFVSTTLA